MLLSINSEDTLSSIFSLKYSFAIISDNSEAFALTSLIASSLAWAILRSACFCFRWISSFNNFFDFSVINAAWSEACFKISSTSASHCSNFLFSVARSFWASSWRILASSSSFLIFSDLSSNDLIIVDGSPAHKTKITNQKTER